MKMVNQGNHIDRLNLNLMGLSFPVIFFLVLVAIAFAVWYYRNTVPPVTGWKKCVLITLRSTALALLLIGLAEPVVNVISTATKKSKIAVLLDTSSSINQKDDPSRKSDALGALRIIRSILDNDGVYFTFDNRLRDIEQKEPDFSGSGTDILNAITAVRNKTDVSSIILISDGCCNLGEDPAGSSLPADIPVNTITVGSSELVTDVVIKKISAASIGHDGENLPVEIVVTSTRELPDQIPVEAVENDQVLASGSVSFRNGITARINFDIPLRGHGDHTFSVIIKPANDGNTENNIRSFGVHVVKSTFRILIAADKPSADLAFIRRVIESDNTFELEIIVDKGVTGQLQAPFPDDLSGFDALILINWGGSALTPQKAEILKKWILTGGGIWILGSSPLSAEADIIKTILPVTFSNTENLQDTPFYMELTEIGSTHFITSEDISREREWNILPPLTSIMPVSKIAPDGSVLAKAIISSKNNSLPAIITGKFGSGKTLVMPISGIWRWKLMMEGTGKGGDFFNNFVIGTINWLTSDTETSPLTVTPDYTTYLSGQEINLEARLYNNVYVPVAGAEITLVIDNDPASKIIFQETKPATYTGQLNGLKAGKHGFNTVAFLDGKRFAECADTLTVQNFSLEMLDPLPNTNLMKTIAARTGGISVTSSGIDSILTHIKPEIRTERYEDKHYLHLNPLMPLLIVLLLTVEWSIRKYRGMI